MANGQYVISGPFSEPEQPPQPSQLEQQPADVLNVLDAPLTTPEVQPTPFGYIKEISLRLESYRSTAVALEEAKRPWLKSMKSLVLTPKPFRAELIDKESVIGGRRFHKQDQTHDVRFWEESGEWFFGYSDGKNIKLTDSTIHYEIFDDHIKKSYRGAIIPFAPGELEILLQAIQSYEHDVVHELYPLDETIQELKKDDFGLAA